MTRSLCIVSRDYPTDASSSDAAQKAESAARGFAALGLSVHVICSDPSGTGRQDIEGCVVVHRVGATSQASSQHGDLEASLGSIAAASLYESLDTLVDFDIVFCTDSFAQSLRIMPGPHTALVIELGREQHHPSHLEARWNPVDALCTAMDIVALQRADLIITESEELTNQTACFIDRPIVTLPAPFEAAAYLDLFNHLDTVPRLAAQLRAPSRSKPKLGVVVVADSERSATTRCVESLLHHTHVPLELVVVNNAASTDTRDWIDNCTDSRLRAIHLPTPCNIAVARNVGSDQLGVDVEFVAFLDSDTEVLARWWEPFTRALEQDNEAGLAGENGAYETWSCQGRTLRAINEPGIMRCDVIGGFCMVMPRKSLVNIGRFDERFACFSHDDFARRAARIGAKTLRIASGRVLHLGHLTQSVLSENLESSKHRGLSPTTINADLQLLANKRARQAVNATTPFLVIADANDAIANTDLLELYGSAFTAADESALVLFGVGIEPLSYELSLRATAERCGFDMEAGPKVIAICPPTATEADVWAITDEVHAVAATNRPSASFGHLAWIAPADPKSLRRLAANVWLARNMSVAIPVAASHNGHVLA